MNIYSKEIFIVALMNSGRTQVMSFSNIELAVGVGDMLLKNGTIKEYYVSSNHDDSSRDPFVDSTASCLMDRD